MINGDVIKKTLAAAATISGIPEVAYASAISAAIIDYVDPML